MSTHDDEGARDRGDEHTGLLDHGNGEARKLLSYPAMRAVPIAFLVSLGIHMTATSIVWAFAYLSCEDANNCKPEESRTYAGSVAAATTLANTAGLLSLGYMKQCVQWNVRLGLALCIFCRALGVLGILCGVLFQSFPCALIGQILCGLASDNLLHYILNSIYVHSESPATTSRLMGTSLACYMIGMAVGPLAAGCVPFVHWTFALAIGIFMITIAYVFIAIPSIQKIEEPAHVPSAGAATFLSPLRFFRDYPTAILFGMSLFLYNTVQGYLVNLIFIFTSVQLHYTPKDNGTLLSIIAITAAGYLMSVSFILPKIAREKQIPLWLDLGAATISILGQAGAAMLLTQSHQVYLAASLTAIGLATPSFIRSLVVTKLESAKSQAVAGLAAMETAGGLLSPIVLGQWQAADPGVSAFYGVAGILIGSLGCLMMGAWASTRTWT
uniref:Pen7 n=1 Tax=Penicillium steckii TaxID=303698 RepID=A0A7T1TTA2_9EURO|nr:Pen7 [Penicillium steckii]